MTKRHAPFLCSTVIFLHAINNFTFTFTLIDVFVQNPLLFGLVCKHLFKKSLKIKNKLNCVFALKLEYKTNKKLNFHCVVVRKTPTTVSC